MTPDEQNVELEAAIASAQLTEDEATKARELHAQGGQIASLIPFILSERDAEPEPDDDPVEQAPPGATEPTKKQLDALDNEQARHIKRVHAIMGEFVAGFEPCETCNSIGLVAPGDPPPQPQTHEWFKACPTCAGFGLVLTGSTRPGQESRDCPSCKGRGYLEAIKDGQPLADASSAIAVTPPPPPPPTDDAAAANGSSEVTFGTPSWMGDPALSS